MRKFLLTMVALFIMCGFGSAQNNNVIEKELQEILDRRSDEMVEVTIMMKSQIEAATLKAKVVRTDDKSLQKEIVVGELKDFAKNTQNDVMAVLKAEEASGNVSDINALWIVNAISCKATREVIYMLSSHPDIAVMSYDKQMQLLEKEEMEYEEETTRDGQGGMAPYLVGANNVWWGTGYTGKNVVVAVLDSGINYYHHNIRNNLWTGVKDGEEIHGWNFATSDEAGNSDILDEFGHGTHCAGIVCGSNDIGVAPDAQLMTVKVVGRAGTGSVTQMLKGVQFAIENGADVLSMSLGFKNSQLSTAQKEEIRAAFDNVLEAGVIVCAAAGNDGDTYGAPYNVDYPAACPSPWTNPDQTLEGGLSSVICVGAHDLSMSSRGPSTWQDTEYNDYQYTEDSDTEMGLIRPDISAPGSLIYSLNHKEVNKYKLMSGTSQSTPAVAGVIALMLEKNPNLTPAQICEILETTAVDKPAKKNNIVGSGRVEAYKAIMATEVQSQKAFIKLESYTPNVATQGSNNNIVLKMKNNGKGTSSVATSLLLETSSPYISLGTTTATLGAVTPGSTIEVPFTINVNAETPNNHSAYFTVITTDGAYSWKDNFSINVSSISDIVYYSVDPSVINVNETVDINVSMKNIGTGPMNGNTTLTLLTTSADLKQVTLIDDEATLGPIGAGETAVGTFTIKAHNDAVTHNYPIDFFLQINSSTQSSTFDIAYEFENDMEGWTTFDANDNDIDNPYFHSNKSFEHNKTPKHSHSGAGHIMSETMPFSNQELPTPIDNYFVSPKVKVTSDSKISFWARAHHDNYYAEHFGVAVSTNSNDNVNDFSTIQEWDITESQGTEWTKYTADLSSYDGKEIYVSIRHFFTQEQWNNLNNGYDVDALNIDDVVIYDVAIDFNFTPTYSDSDKTYFNINISNPLPKVTGLAATVNGVDEIALTWNEIGRAKSYNIYRDNVLVANTEETSYTDSGLTHNTKFCYEVAAVGGGFIFERSDKVYATTNQKEYSALLKEYSPETIYIDGETSEVINMIIKNDGSKQFKAKANYTLTCDDDTYVSINNNTDLINALQPEAEVSKNITITLNENIPNNHVINFNIRLESSYVYEPYTFDLPFVVNIKNDPNAPKGLELVNASDNSVSISWRAINEAMSYNVYRDGEYIGSTSSTTYFDNAGLQASTKYRYEVTSITETGESDMSKPLYVTTALANNSVKLQSFVLSKPVGAATLTATFVNKGSAATPAETNVTLVCDDQYVTIDNSTINLGSIAVDGTATVEFSVIISNEVPVNHNIDFNAVIAYEGEVLRDFEYNFDNDFEGWIAVNYDGHMYSNGSKPHTWYHYSEKKLHSPNEPDPYDGDGYIVNATYCNASGHSHTSKTVDDIILCPEKIKIKSDTEISFYVRSTATSTNYCKEHYGVTVTQELLYDGLGSTYNNVWEETLSTTGWKQITYNFNNYIGKEYYIGIRHFGCNGDNADGLCIDKVEIKNAIIAGNLTITSSFSVTANPSVNIYTGTGTWDIASNWSKGLVPTATDNVIINGNVKIESGNIIINALSINEGMSLTIGEGSILSINDIFVNTNANAFIIKDGAQVFQNNNNVAATFVMNIYIPESWDNNHTEGWQFISSPMTNANISDFEPQYETGYDLFKYDGSISGAEWINYKGHINEFEKTFQQGRGYIASYEAQTTAEFAGTLNKATSFNFNVAYDGVGSWANFHLLGNPFTFNMDWDNVALTNVYDGFATIDPEEGGYVVSYGEGIIPVGDGFFVEAIGENPSISYPKQSKSRGENDKADYINLIATGAQGSNNLIVKFSGAEEKGFSKLKNINPNIADIYVKNNGRQYSILGYDQDVQEIEVFFEAKEMGSYSISFDINGEFENVVLVDRLTGVETNMLLEDEYTFVASSNDNPNRFVLLINDDSTSTSLSNFAYINNRDIVIYDINGNANIKIFDAMGRCVFNGSCTDAIHRVPAEGFSAGVYVIQKVDDNGVNVQKIIL